MAIHIDSKDRLHINNSRISLGEDDGSVGVCDEESEDGAKCDSNTEDYISAEEEDEHKHPESVDSGVSLQNTFQSELSISDKSCKSLDEFSFFKKPGEELVSPDGALESAALLAEGIKTLGKTQQENWKRMNDLISKKDNLIKEMTNLVTSFKKKMASPNACYRDNCKPKLNLCESCRTPVQSTLIPERDTSALWSQNQVDFIENVCYGPDSFSKCTYSETNILCECSIQENLADEKAGFFLTDEMPILEVPRGYRDEQDAENDIMENFLKNDSPLGTTVSKI